MTTKGKKSNYDNQIRCITPIENYDHGLESERKQQHIPIKEDAAKKVKYSKYIM